MSTPEQIPFPPSEEDGIRTVPETVSLPPQIEKAGVISTPTTPAPVTDDSTGQVVADSHPSGQQNAITLPDDPDTARVMAKSSPSEAKRGRGMFILRQIKKAFHFGRKIIWTSS